MFGTKKIKRAFVLGAGPAGLLAAHAAEEAGLEVFVFSAQNADGSVKKSELFGCQYLHEWVPGLGMGTAGRGVRYLLDGNSEDYRRKVYGEGWSGSVSPDEYGPEKSHLAWDLRKAYDILWDRLGSTTIPIQLTPDNVDQMKKDPRAITLSSIPVPALCRKPEEHKFVTQDVWAMGSTKHRSSELPFNAPDMTVQCNAHEAPRWYRAASVFGYCTLEWPAGPKPPVSGVAAVRKPLSTDCDCHLGDRWARVGRYGRWAKGVLVHTAYFDTRERLR